MKISKNIEIRTEIFQKSRKQNGIGFLSRYSTSSLISQSKPLTKNNVIPSPNRHLHQLNL